MPNVRSRSLEKIVALVATLASVACQKPLDRSAPSAVDRVPVAAPTPSVVPSAAPSSSAPPSDAWHRGTWTGSYQSVAHHLDLPPAQGGLPEWKVDDSKGVGNGTLSVTASPEGSVVGTATGPLGHQDIRGAFEGDGLSARLFPVVGDSAAFAGTLVAHREGTNLVGTLTAGSTDGHHARTATLTLAKSAP